LRTYFGDEAAWDALCAAVQAPVGEFRAYVTPVNDRTYAELSIEDVVALGSEAGRGFILVGDRVAQLDPEHPLLVIDLYDEPGRTFRVIPSETCSVDNNLSIRNMDFYEFADAVDERGVFRGFPSD
jgi:hypothetical protein